jgi:hypothetical protein
VGCQSLRASRRGGGGLNWHNPRYGGSAWINHDLAVPHFSAICHWPICLSSEKARIIATK